jgi:hypothetical protein
LNNSNSAPSSSSAHITSRSYPTAIDGNAPGLISSNLITSILTSNSLVPIPINGDCTQQFVKDLDFKRNDNISNGRCDVVTTNDINVNTDNKINFSDTNPSNIHPDKNKLSNSVSSKKLLSKPAKHPSRSSKMYVPSQIHSGEASMQHVVFTDSSTSFNKMRYLSIYFLI